jgi:hypothetical protein
MDIDFEADETLKDSHWFTGIKSIHIEKQDIFSYGVFKRAIPPEKLGDNNFDYLQSKIPTYHDLYDDQIRFQENSKKIIAKVTGEDAKDISEIVGIAVGLKSAEAILKLEKKAFRKITTSETHGRHKRLDFESILNGKKIEIETKGTTYTNKVSNMIDDIHKKKEDQKGLHPERINRYGFVTVLQKIKDKNTAKIFATDPEDYSTYQSYEGIYSYIDYYLIYLSFILDNTNYNRIVKILKNRRSYSYRKPLVRLDKLRYKFEYGNKEYYGQCFDKRLILEIITKLYKDDDTVHKLFLRLTGNIGKIKYFLGIDIDIIKNLNYRNTNFLNEYQSYNIYKIENDIEYIQMSDGILFIKSANGQLKKLEEQFSEKEVEKRLKELFYYTKKEPHQCGAPCRSREKEGKPCKILTYREYCHFHR